MTTLNTTGYDEWENDRNIKALEWAQDLLNDFNDQIYSASYTCNQIKPILQYTLIKVWHILYGSGIVMVYTIKKKGINHNVKIELDLLSKHIS
jgi:hypothetical protein